MAIALLPALLLASIPALAQVDGGVPPAPSPAAPSPAAPPAALDVEQIRREMEQKLEAQRREFADQLSDLRGQLATQTVAEEWQKEWVEEKRKLELFTLDGYFRVRPDLFYKFDLNESPDPGGFTLWPRSPSGSNEHTQAGVNQRARLEPTFNISEDIRLKAQIDLLDNLVWGSIPDYAFTNSQLIDFGIFSENQSVARTAINAVQDSISVKRVWGEVSTPVGIIRAGRMAFHWGTGMLHNDGNCLDCDHGDTVDRAMFVAEPLEGLYITPMIDFNVEGPTSQVRFEGGQPFDLSNSDDAHSFSLAIAKKDTDAQAKAKLENNLAVFNYGALFTYRFQRKESVDFYNSPFVNQGGNIPPGVLASGYVNRGGSLYIPDIWVKFEKKAFRLELEAAGVFGEIKNRALSGADATNPTQDQSLSILQFGAVAQGEYRLLEGALKLHMEVGYASGDRAPGMGNLPGRKGSGPDGSTAPGDINGPQYACQSTGVCSDGRVSNFRFNRDYRIDMILWREILGPITDAVYVRPGVNYTLADGISLFGYLIYSRTIFPQSTPSYSSPELGVELNAGVRYETEDGFFAQLRYGILFPLAGLRALNQSGSLESAQAVRGLFGIKF